MPASLQRRALGALPVCVAVTLLVAACSPVGHRSGDADLQLRWSFEPNPPQVGAGSIRVDVSNVSWEPRNGARVILTGIRDGVELFVDTAQGEGAGRYLATDFRFEVAGDWILRARVETPEGSWTEEEYSVEVVAGEK